MEVSENEMKPRPVNDLPWMNDIMLNLPHVVVSTVMPRAAYGIELRATERAGTPAMA